MGGFIAAEIGITGYDFLPPCRQLQFRGHQHQAGLGNLERLGEAVLVKVVAVFPDLHHRIVGGDGFGQRQMHFRLGAVGIGQARQPELLLRYRRQAAVAGGKPDVLDGLACGHD
ncbi:hypothetical protein GALL_443660 [mine drainage metagenome]|uniref:Uncharacterized protein n=1 Tax=mine drainage metagenome TaxID=410659 RepID=A0A1J5PQW5_9ZZZZ